MRIVGVIVIIIALAYGWYQWDDYQYRSRNGHMAMERCQEMAEYKWRRDDLPIIFYDWSLWGEKTEVGRTWIFHGQHGDTVFECFISFDVHGTIQTTRISDDPSRFLRKP